MRGAALLLAFAAVSAGCAQPPSVPQPPTVGGCNAAAAQFAVGMPGSVQLAGRAMQAAGAQRFRWLRPGEVVTMEYDASRLNLELDASGKVIRVRCG
jgi:hypothetical protein